MSAVLLQSRDVLQLLSQLDGSLGKNRSQNPNSQISAQTDIQALQAWLARYEHSPRTYANYRKEAERLLLWAVIEQGKALSSLQYEDMQAYQHFLSDPQPAARWQTPAGSRPARGHPTWRPFAGPLSASSQRQAMLILNGLFSWLVQAAYLAANPLALAPRRPTLQTKTERYLSQESWHALQEYIFSLPEQTAGQKHIKSRARWLLSILYGTGLRISELTQASMADVYSKKNTDQQELWWLRVVGKGNKLRHLPITQELLHELQSYRLDHGLPALPSSLEQRPLLMPIGGGDKPLGRAAVHAMIKQLGKAAAARLRQRNPAQEAHALQLERFSAHWIRHTAGSHMANQKLDIRIIRDTLGHASISTSNIYLHTEDEQRHAALEQAHHLHWDKPL